MLSATSIGRAAIFSQKGLAKAQEGLSDAVEKLSSGLRINRAKDDAARLRISLDLNRQIKTLEAASKNALSAISMLQTADGGLSAIGDQLQRLKQLSVQGQDGALGAAQLKSISDEMEQIRQEINGIATRTTFNGYKLLTGDMALGLVESFDTTTGLITSASRKSVLATSTFNIGDTASNGSLYVNDIRAYSAETATYKITASGSTLTLAKTVDGTTTSENLELVSSSPAAGQTAWSSALNGITTLDFSSLGVQIDIKNLTGVSNTSTAASTIAGIGNTSTGTWTSIAGADWSTAYSASTTVRAFVTARSADFVKIGQTTGLSYIAGYSGNWTSGGAYQIAFQGTMEAVGEALATLQAKQSSADGYVDVLITEPTGLPAFINNGKISYYQAFSNGNGSWTNARALALASRYTTNDGTVLSGYLTNVTSAEEQAFIRATVGTNAWIGASDVGSEGTWKWMDGPVGEAGATFWTSSSGVQSGYYANWAGGEPNNSGGEDYAHIYGREGETGEWNDFPDRNVTSYIVEYGGTAQSVAPGTYQRFSIGSSNIGVNYATDIETVTATTTRPGIFKLVGDEDAGTLTLKRYDFDESGLLESQVLSVSALASGAKTTYNFDLMDVSIQIENRSDIDLTLGDVFSGLDAEVEVARTTQGNIVDEDQPTFQTGEAVNATFVSTGFRDTRLNGSNLDSASSTLFDAAYEKIAAVVASASNRTASNFRQLQNLADDLIAEIGYRRSYLGASQNRLESNATNLSAQSAGLQSSRKVHLETDFAAETARFTKMQIGQQAAAAAVAQANLVPNLILSLLAAE